MYYVLVMCMIILFFIVGTFVGFCIGYDAGREEASNGK